MLRSSRGEFSLRPFLVGGGHIAEDGRVRRLQVDMAGAKRYADAQLDDYSGLPRGRFRWKPPLRLQVRARVAPGTRGTAGFGFWNNPFNPVSGIARLPDAVWFFFASPPNDMALVPGVPGNGWKAAVVHGARPGTVLWGVPALPAMLWARVTGRAGAAGWCLQHVTGAHEAPVSVDPGEWHQYAIEWETSQARFTVDGQEVLCAPSVPHGPLGFVAWIDNQYAVVTPRLGLGWGLLEVNEPQWLDLDIEELAGG